MKRLSLLTKLELIEYHERESATYEETSQKFCVGRGSVSRALANKCSLVTLYNSTKGKGAKAFVYSDLAVINSELANWYRTQSQRKNFKGITQIYLKKQLAKILRDSKIESFEYTGKWMKEFVRKYEVTLKKQTPAKLTNNDTKNKLPQGDIVSKTEKLPGILKKQKISLENGKISQKTEKVHVEQLNRKQRVFIEIKNGRRNKKLFIPKKQKIFSQKNKKINHKTKEVHIEKTIKKKGVPIENKKGVSTTRKVPVVPKKQKISEENEKITQKSEKVHVEQPREQPNKKQKVSIENMNGSRKTKKLPVIPKKQKLSEKHKKNSQNERVHGKQPRKKQKVSTEKLQVKTRQPKFFEESKSVNKEIKKFSKNQSTSSSEEHFKKTHPLPSKTKIAIKQNNQKIKKTNNIAHKNKHDFLKQVGLNIKQNTSKTIVRRRTRGSCKLFKESQLSATSNPTENNDASPNVPENENYERFFWDESEEIGEGENQEKVTNGNNLKQIRESSYYDTIERDNIVEFVRNNKQQSIELSIEDPEPSTSNVIEELNANCLGSKEDVFKNLKIQVLPHGFVDESYEKDNEDENNDNDCTFDGEEADDEFEDNIEGDEIDDGFKDDIDGQSSQGQAMLPPNQIPQQPNSLQSGYRPPMAPGNRPPNPRGGQPGGVRMPGGNPRPLMNQRAPGMRARAPMVRPRGAIGLPPMRGQMRPRTVPSQNGIRAGQPKPMPKRNQDQNNASLQAKRKRMEVLTPSDKEDDDCQVIFTQPKNTGLPQIEHIQGASEAVDNAIMKLPDSITLSVRPPAPKSVSSPQKSEAKAVANVLASRGITVTPSAKPKESPKQASPTVNLNGAVSIVSPSKGGAKAADGLPTVDLTDDSPSDSANRNRPGLPYRCDLCPATYPNAMGLNKHRQTYHKTTSGMSELGIPLINLKQPGIMQKLSQFGVNHYIPMPSTGPGGTYAIPIINSKSPSSLVSALDSTQILTLGPVRNILRAGASSNTNNAGKK